MAIPRSIQLDINHEFSRLIIERGRNEYGEPAINIRWGGANVPVLSLSVEEARQMALAIASVISS